MTTFSYLLRHALCMLACALPALPLMAQGTARPADAPAVALTAVNWQHHAVPYYTTVDMLHGLYRHGQLPHIQALARDTALLSRQLQSLCQAPADDTTGLVPVQDAWRSAVLGWERLTAVAVGPVLERRSQRTMDFTPARPRLIERAIHTQPRGAKAFERIGTPAKGLPALEWLLFTAPMAPGTPSCTYAHEVARDVEREVLALQQALSQRATAAWGDEEQQAASTTAMSEWVNQWVGGLERLRWARMEKPLRAAADGTAADYPRRASQLTAAAWTAAWISLRSQTLWSDTPLAIARFPIPSANATTLPPTPAPTLAALAHPPAPGQALVPLELLLRGRGLNPLADRLAAATQRVDAGMADIAQHGVDHTPAVQATAKALAALKYLAESEVAPALQISIGFSDADGD